MAQEIFKHVEGFGRYLVSNTGRVISTARGVRELKPQKDAIGYFHVRLYKEDKSLGDYGPGRGKRPKLYKVHTLVAEHFIDKPKSKVKLEINHLDGDKSNNNIDNLEWVTRQENMAHSWSTGLHNDAPYKAAEKRRVPCYAKLPDGTIEYFHSRVHAAIAFSTTPFTVIQSIKNNRPVSRYKAKGVQFFHIDELPPGETFKMILDIEKKIMDLNDKWYPNRSEYMKKWNAKRKKHKK